MGKLNPFDYVNSINDKKYIFREEDEGAYNKDCCWTVTKAFANLPETLFLANLANRLGLRGKQHYDFFYYVLTKRKRFSEWHKTEKIDALEVIQEYYGCNINRAREYLKALSDNDIKTLKKKLERGGKP